MVRLITNAITDQYPKRNRSSGAFVIMVFSIFLCEISAHGELVLLLSS